MKLLRFFTLFLLFFINTANAATRLSEKDYDRLVDFGYNKLNAYPDDYSGVKAYWYTLEEQLALKPKFLALLTQEMQLDGKVIINTHVYNSRHHVFASRDAKCGNENKKLFDILKKCEDLKMPIIEDEDISIDDFARTIIDHCNETKTKNLKTQSGKLLNISQEKKCSIKYINFTRYHFANVLKKSVDESPPKKNNINLDNFKKECEDLGFKPKTEKFGECVLRLVESSKR
jgi:hypothetical protein